MSRRHDRWAAFALLGSVVALAGCDSSTKGSGTPAGSGRPSGGSSGTVAATSPAAPATSSAPGTFARSAPPPHAADGTNVAACADGRCEVTVRAGTAIPLPKSMNVEKVTVTTVSRSRVTITGHDLGDSSGGGCTGTCDSSSSNGTFKIALGVDSQATENGLALTVEQIAGGTAVVEIAPV